jgi:hypothetical protein
MILATPIVGKLKAKETHMRHSLTRTGSILLLLTFMIVPARAENGISIRVTPQLCVEGSNVRITVNVERRDDNRMLTIVADSPDFFRISSIQLSGDRAAVQHQLMLNALPSGTYEVRATLTRENDQQASDAMSLRVYGKL